MFFSRSAKCSIGQGLSALPWKTTGAKGPFLKEISHSSEGCLKNFRMAASVNFESSSLSKLSTVHAIMHFHLLSNTNKGTMDTSKGN